MKLHTIGVCGLLTRPVLVTSESPFKPNAGVLVWTPAAGEWHYGGAKQADADLWALKTAIKLSPFGEEQRAA